MGRAVCERLLEEGAAGVVGFDVNAETLGRTAAELGDERFVPFAGDVSDSSAVRRSVETCLDRFDRLDLMVAHAGIAEPRPLLDTDDDHWRRHLAVNVDGVFWCVREAARAMVARGTRGAIVCTSSINAWHVEETHAAYNTSKAAVHAIARSAAIDLGPRGIRVNSVAPGVVDTPLAELVVHDPELAPQYLRTIPLGRFGEPRDIANAVLFLASDEASYITGQMLVLDGGQTLGIRVDLESAAAHAGEGRG
jgi:NAD(P)-dependent dehydrogenase (short-subunit alcohol dehydrogenase family)